MEEDTAERLREENPEQFFILVRMHLSFLIDMNTDENESPNDKPKSFKWGFSKKFKSGSNTYEATSKTSGSHPKVQVTAPLTDDNIKQIYQLIDILSLESNLIQEGIFRRTGSLSRQQQLRRLLTNGGTLDDDASSLYSAHDMASVLKGILADTPEPLLQHHQAYCHLATTYFTNSQPIASSETKLIDAIRLLLLLLPAATRQLVKRLLLLLNKTVSFESSNRMYPGALATMFTPHVLCPRRLSPEALHSDSQNLSPILSFMIRKASTLFVSPPQLATDVAAYLAKKQHQRLLSPNGEDLNESVSERTAASTVFTFVDRQMSGVDVKDGGATDAALAQLYAHIQSLPESHNKRRLIKQFNRENGHGTPLQLQRAHKQKSIGESLKKHIFARSLMSKTGKKPINLNDQRFGYHPIIENKSSLKTGLKQSASDMSLNEPKPLTLSSMSLKHDITVKNLPNELETSEKRRNKEGKTFLRDETDEELDVFSNTTDDNLDEASLSCDEANTPLKRVERLTPKYTSEPNLSFLPSNHEITPKYTKSKSSKLFKSKTTLQSNIISKKDMKKHDIQKLQKIKHNSIDKDTSEHSLRFKSCVKCSTDSFSEADYSANESKPSISNEVSSPRSENTHRLVKKDSLKYMRHKRNMSNRSNLSIKETSPGDKKSMTPPVIEDLSTPKVSLMRPNYLTSTPAVSNALLNTERNNFENCSTPMFPSGHILRRGSMSPITKSTQKMPKAMQESIMTPRSRKPVIINFEPATTTSMIPCPSHMISHHSVNVNSTSDSSTTDTVYDSTPSSMKNDSDFVSTDESCPSSSYIKYKHINDIDILSREKTHSSNDHFPCISDSVISERRLRSIQERKYQRLLEKKNQGIKPYNTDHSKTTLLDDNDSSESDSDSSPNAKSKSIHKNVSLSGPFREYLLNRSVLTGSPVDLSFASGPEDYYNSKSDTADNLSEGKMTESLLFCMNGNVPADLTINSDFDNSDTVPLLKQSNGNITKHITIVEQSKNETIGKKYRKFHRNDNLSTNCDTDPLNKENVSPGTKRPAQNVGNGTDQEVIEIKKVNVSITPENQTAIDETLTVNPEFSRHREVWNYDKYGPLWETNL